MKILYITNNLSGSDGWSRYSIDIAKAFDEQETLWVVSNKLENKFSQKKLLYEPLRYLSNIFWVFVSAVKINKTIKSFSPDVVHFLVEPYLMVLPFLNIKKAKIVSTVHGTYSFLPNTRKNGIKKIILLWWIKFIYKKIDNIVAVSNYTKNYLIGCLNDYHIKGVKEKITVISNGVDFYNFYRAREKKYITKTKHILFVGAVKRRKGLHEAINALKFYNDNFSSDFVFDIVGYYKKKDKYYLYLKSLINSYELDDKIKFKNRVDELILRDYYVKADLFLMLSTKEENKFEGFGLVYLEANTYGVPCVGAKYSGAEDAILDGKTGYLAEANSRKDVSDKINLVLDKHTINSDVCVSWAKQNDIKIKSKEIFEIYKKIK